MSLLDQTNLLSKLDEYLRPADAVSIAVAWITPCDALDKIIAFARRPRKLLRVIAGVGWNRTDPRALSNILDVGALKICEPDNGVFHPKLFIFGQTAKTICWVGSSNLTMGGFQVNNELVFSYEDNGTTQKWFETLWNSLEEADEKIVGAYAKGWKPPIRQESAQSHTGSITKKSVSLADVRNWAQYVAALRKRDVYWRARSKGTFDVLGETASWAATISLAHSMTTWGNWNSLNVPDYRLLMGIETRNREGYGLLGSMTGAGTARHIFRSNDPESRKTRRKIHGILTHVIQTKTNFPKTAADALAEISAIKHLGGGIASRLLALARPNMAVSVNDGSRDGLARLTGLPATMIEATNSAGEAPHYKALLEWVEEQPWHGVPEPSIPLERLVWGMRAALIDCFVYGG